MYTVQTCTNVPKWGWIDVGVRDNVGTRWGHLAPEKRTQREGQLRREVLVRGTISFSIDTEFSEQNYKLDGKRSHIFTKMKDRERDSCEEKS